MIPFTQVKTMYIHDINIYIYICVCVLHTYIDKYCTHEVISGPWVANHRGTHHALHVHIGDDRSQVIGGAPGCGNDRSPCFNWYPSENHRKTIEKPWENHGKTIAKP